MSKQYVFDPINPNYYLLPDGSEVIDTTLWLSGCAAQAVQYVVRSTRLDGFWKDQDARVQDLKKSIWFIDKELERFSEPVFAKKYLEPHRHFDGSSVLPNGCPVTSLTQWLPEDISSAIVGILRICRIDGEHAGDIDILVRAKGFIEKYLAELNRDLAILRHPAGSKFKN